jgi:hypothetical protein
MTKYIATIFNVIILSLDGVGISDHQSVIHWFMRISQSHLLFHLGLSIILLGYVLVPMLRSRITQTVLLGVGLALFISGIVGLFSPNYFRHLANTVLILDIFFLVESGIVTMLIALETPLYEQEEMEVPSSFAMTHDSFERQMLKKLVPHS